MTRAAAFQGKGWKPRSQAHAAELSGRIWAPWRVDSEYKRLEAVLLYCPGGELREIKNPDAAQHLARINPAAIKKEFGAVAAAFRRLGVKVFFLPRAFPGRPAKYNLMFVRDLFFNTPEGAVLSRMASRVRAGEEKYAAVALAENAVPIVRTVSGRGHFEGADALWLDRKTVLCGVGNRTDAGGYRQLRETLKGQGVETIAVPLPRGVQHLLGMLQIVDARLAFLRVGVASPKVFQMLLRRGFSIVQVQETAEVAERQGMNIVTVSPRKIMMPADCPNLKRTFQAAGVTVAAELDVRQIRRGAGGLACATGILSRKI